MILSLRNLILFSTVLLAAPLPAQEAQDPDAAWQTVDPEERITISFDGEDLTAILDMFATTYGLNIVYGSDVQGSITMNLHDAPVRQAFEQILAAAGYTYTTQDTFILVRPPGGSFNQRPSGPNPHPPEIFFLNHVRAEDIAPMIEPILGPQEIVVPGPSAKKGITDLEDLGGNELAVREMILVLAGEETKEKIRALLAQVDIPPLQIEVQATILQVALNDSTTMGVDFNVLSGVDFQAMGGETDVTDSISLDPVTGGSLGNWLLGARQGGFTQPGSSGLHVGILRDQVGVFVEALETVGNATVLSNPTVLALNRHAAQILVGRRIGYQTLTVSQTSTTQNVQFLEVGTTLTFRPFATEDGYVRMEVHPENSDGLISAATGLPEESTAEVTTNVLVRSGHTIVIGGLMEESLSTNISQVPLLGSIPILGQLFRREEQTETKTEIIVLLTPRIVNDEQLTRKADEARQRHIAAAAELAASHHGYLRPAYARRMYAKAAAALAEGDPALALAKAEWGLAAMPADPDLAMLAHHAREELRATELERKELEEALQILDRDRESQR